ncbi:MAG: phosphoglycerate dehydrogenase [Bacillota bacterium]|nr:phosphoglycerate dehydrogenase [Bacillota bacterium]
MYKIAVFNKICEEGLALLPEDDYKLTAEDTNEAEGILVRSAKLHNLEMPDSIRGIARAGAGTNNIPVSECSEKGIVVFNTPGANANAVSELTLLGLLLSSRKVYEGIEWAKTLQGDVEKKVEKGKEQFAGPELKGKTLGTIGLGAIGVLAANSGIKLGMKVIGYDPYISVKNAIGLSWDMKYAENIEELLGKADYITLHLPLIKETAEFINKEKIDKMKDGVRLLNFSRASLVNENDVINALDAGKISKYVTDFPTEKMIESKNAVCLPHLGASTPEAEENCAIMAVSQLKDFLENGNIRNSVNLPDCSLGRNPGTVRITVINKNVPNMIGALSGILAKYHINIIEMVNKSRGDFAYNILDVSGFVSEEILDEIRHIQGILRVTYLP